MKFNYQIWGYRYYMLHLSLNNVDTIEYEYMIYIIYINKLCNGDGCNIIV